jgi:acetate kinase
VARRFPLPREFWDQGVRRYGFHGLSYEYVVEKLGNELGKRAIIAHLGNGASAVALKDRKPVDTSMGLTPTGGFMMGTRTGDLDPGVILYLLRSGRSVEQIARLVDYRSGLLGVSGLASEMKTLLDSGEQNLDAAQAVEMFCYQVRKFIGAYTAALGGLDTLVFTGGIGEHAGAVRARIADGLEFLGIELDPEANSKNAEVISVKTSRCSVRVIRTDEDLMIVRHTKRMLRL